MELVFTKDIGRFRAGEVRDYPLSVWKQIERSVRRKRHRFTRPVDEAVAQGLNGIPRRLTDPPDDGGDNGSAAP